MGRGERLKKVSMYSVHCRGPSTRYKMGARGVYTCMFVLMHPFHTSSINTNNSFQYRSTHMCVDKEIGDMKTKSWH